MIQPDLSLPSAETERESSSVAAHQFPFCSVILEATPQLGIALRKSGTPWKVILLRVLPIKERRGVGQTWLLKTGATDGTHPTQWQGLRPGGNDWTKKARTDVWDKIKQQRDHHQGGQLTSTLG